MERHRRTFFRSHIPYTRLYKHTLIHTVPTSISSCLGIFFHPRSISAPCIFLIVNRSTLELTMAPFYPKNSLIPFPIIPRSSLLSPSSIRLISIQLMACHGVRACAHRPQVRTDTIVNSDDRNYGIYICSSFIMLITLSHTY